MHPHSYTIDALSKAQDLVTTILSSSTPSQIVSTCAFIDSFLHTHSPYQSRHFFTLTFPTLICKLFGFDDTVSPLSKSQSPKGWVDTVLVSNDPDLANRIFALLAPDSVLFQSISAVDSQSFVKYVFPIERLPEWVRFMLSIDKDCSVLSDLCPLFRGKVKVDSIKGSVCQVQLNVFEYFMFWFAYYPVCRGIADHSDSVSVKRVTRFRLENWASSIPGFSSSKQGSEQKNECNLYVRLLYAYLRAFVPLNDLNVHQPYRGSLLHYSMGCDGSVLVEAEFLVNTLIHYWLVDNDFSPLPVNLIKSFGVAIPSRSVLGETPPAYGLGEVVKLFVKYLNLNSVFQYDGTDGTEYSGSPRWKCSISYDSLKSREVNAVSPGLSSVGCWNLLVQRPLYRFILRTFLSCPAGSLTKNISHVFSVWVSYMEAWAISSNDFSELETNVKETSKNENKDQSQSGPRSYSPSWQGYVLSNYLYYNSMVMHFIGFAHKFLHADVETIVQMVSKVLSILTSSKELTDLIKNVDTAFHSKQAGLGKSVHNGPYRYIPYIREQLQDWEHGLCESDVDGSFLHENWNKDLRLFSNGEDGGQQLLQLFVLRAEVELQAITGDNHPCLDSLKAQISCLFGGQIARTLSFSPERRQSQQLPNEIFKPRRVGTSSACSNIKYKGDWMKRPVSDDEIAWLAKLLVCLSNWLNESLGLNQTESSQASRTWSYVEVGSDSSDVCGATETVKAVSCAISSWFLMLGASMVGLVRKHGGRVNLRMLASKKVVMVLILFVLCSVLKKAFGMFYTV